VLALMLARVIFVVARAAYRHRSIRRPPSTDTNSQEFQRVRKMFAADLSLRLHTLRWIAETAPFLGLAGSCVGILGSFTGIGMSRRTALAILSLNLGRAPITTAAALLVTIPAIWSYNYLRTRLELLQVEISGNAHEAIRQRKRYAGIAQSLPLKKRFSGLPSSAVTVAPCLALVIAGFMTFSSFDISKGLPVRLLGPGERASRKEYFTTDPVVIVVALSKNGSADLYVNSKETPWDEFGTTVQRELKLRPRQVVYVEAESGVRWTDVVNVIDIVELDATVVLSTITPDTKSLRGHHQKLGNGR
jgi:biopolymer transport protein ExbD